MYSYQTNLHLYIKIELRNIIIIIMKDFSKLSVSCIKCFHFEKVTPFKM